LRNFEDECLVRMLVTRPMPDAEETAARLAALDIEAAVLPLLVHETLETGLPDPGGFAALALTSANALRALQERHALEPYLDLPVFAVGNRTAAAAEACGFSRVSSAGGAFPDLVHLLANAALSGPVFYPAARDQSEDLGRSLAPHGVMVITTPVYAMQAIDRLPGETLGELQSGAIAAALFYSRRTAATFADLCGDRLPPAARDRLGVLCLSEAVAEPLLDAHFVRVGLADHPSEEAMMGLALSFARDQNPS
jgi:uroporphyrinogen-III synthase